MSPAASPPRRSAASRRSAVHVAAACTPGVAAAGSAAGRDLLAKLEERVAPLLPTVGVVHLGMEPVAGEGPVLRWKQRLQVLAEPSEHAPLRAAACVCVAGGRAEQGAVRVAPSSQQPPECVPGPPAGDEATALLQSLGHDPHATRLADVLAHQPIVELASGRTLSLLSSQTQWMEGAPLSMLLLSAASPDVVLPGDSLGSLAWLLRGQLVVCSAALLPSGFAAALLQAGAKGVVCRCEGSDTADGSADGGAARRPSAEASADDSCAFFAAFYEALLAGRSVGAALAAGEAQQPALQGTYRVVDCV